MSSSGNFLRYIYLVTPLELGPKEDVFWKVDRPPESGVFWFETYIHHHHNVINMISAETDPYVQYRVDDKVSMSSG